MSEKQKTGVVVGVVDDHTIKVQIPPDGRTYQVKVLKGKTSQDYPEESTVQLGVTESVGTQPVVRMIR